MKGKGKGRYVLKSVNDKKENYIYIYSFVILNVRNHSTFLLVIDGKVKNIKYFYFNINVLKTLISI